MKEFLKKGEVQLINGGYLSNKEGKPVNNYEFVDAQLHAEYIITFAEMAKGKDFKGKKADTVQDLREEVQAALSKKNPVTYVPKPTEVVRPVTDSLAKEALAFMDYADSMSKAEKINQFMQQFNILNDFEQFGLFFDQDIVKLNNIYTVEQIKEAVISTINLL